MLFQIWTVLGDFADAKKADAPNERRPPIPPTSAEAEAAEEEELEAKPAAEESS